MRLFQLTSLVALAACVRSATVSRDDAESEVTSYAGLRFLRLAPTSDEDVSKLKSLISELKLEVLTDHGVNVNFPVDVLVSTEDTEQFDAQFGGAYEVVHEDLAAAIAEEREGFAAPLHDDAGARVAAASAVDLTWFNAYHSYADHITFVKDLQALYPNNSEIVTAGSSVQNKTITGIHIYGKGGKGSNPAVIFHGTIHAREWIATPTVEYIAYQLLTNYANSTQIATVVDTYDFYIFPVTNPDGFSFSQTTTRLWRKNRTPPPSGSSCYGTDLNRNWDIRWSDDGGASEEPCDEDYKGTKVASTPEIQGLIAFSKNLISSTGIELYIDFHSYGQLFLYPFGYDCAVNPDGPYYHTVGDTFQKGVTSSRNTKYTIEQACTLYKTTGASDDFHYGTLGVFDAYTVELPTTSSFVLPATSILPVAKETWEGIKGVLVAGGFGG